jgi:uncharacterized membrane protein
MLTSNIWLTLSYLFHLIATVVWIGGLVTMAFVVQPVANSALTDQKEVARVMEAVQKRFQPLANLSLLVLLLTGMVQLVNNQFYRGFLQLDNTWSVVILLKHLCVIAMIGLAAYITFSLQPAQRRLALLAANDVDDPAGAAHLKAQQIRLARLNLVLSVLVLVFTAVARAQ